MSGAYNFTTIPPCPFCGWQSAPVEHEPGNWSMICLQCVASGPRAATEEDAIILWVRRSMESRFYNVLSVLLSKEFNAAEDCIHEGPGGTSAEEIAQEFLDGAWERAKILFDEATFQKAKSNGY